MPTNQHHARGAVAIDTSARLSLSSNATSDQIDGHVPPMHIVALHQPLVLTTALTAQLAVANRLRRERLYPKLAATLAVISPDSPACPQDDARSDSLQQLAAANRARRRRLREEL